MDKYDLIKSQKRAPQKRKLDLDNSSRQKSQKRSRGTPAKGRIYAGIPDAFNLFPGQPLPEIGTFVDLKFSGYGWYSASITKVTEKPGNHLATKFRINAADETGGKTVSWKSFQTGSTVAPFGRHTRVSSFAAQMSGQPDTMRAKLLAVVRSLMSQRWDRNVERGSQLDDMFYVFFHPVLEMDPSIDAQEYSRVVSSPISFAELRSRINEGEFDDDAYAFFSALEQISTNAEAWVAHKHGPLPDVNPNMRKQILTPARALRRLAKYLWKTHFAKEHTSAGVSKDEIRLQSSC